MRKKTRGLPPSTPAPVQAALLPAAVAIVLSCLGLDFAYLFDDYDFLSRVQVFDPALLLPDPGIVFYRPVSREMYFGLINLLSPSDPLLGHVLGAVLLAATIFLATLWMMDLTGYRVGLVGGLVLAGLSQWPVLAAWASGGQDLLPIILTVVALRLMWADRAGMSLLAFCAGMLAKESAVAAAPALLVVRWLRTQSWPRVMRTAGWIAACVTVWATLHPGVHLLLERGSAGPPSSYIGLDNPNRSSVLLEALIALLNLPVRFPTDLRGEVVVVGVLGLALVTLGLKLALKPKPHGTNAECPALSNRQCAILGLALAVPILLLTCLLVRNWAGYYACFPAVGLALAAAPWLSYRNVAAITVAVAYLTLGIFARGVPQNPEKLTELSLTAPGRALRQVERNFESLMPALPPRSTVYVTTMATGPNSVYYHIHQYQALRIWYAEPTIQTLRPELRVGTSGKEFLFLIEPDLDVCMIDVGTLAARTTGEAVQEELVWSALRSYAIGLANSGETDRAVQILLQHGTGVDARIAGMLLLSQNRVQEAGEILVRVPDMRLRTAFETVAKLLTVPTRDVEYDKHALAAFGLPYDNPEVIENLTSVLFRLGYMEVAARLARHLQSLQPESRYARYVLSAVNSQERFRDVITPPVSKLEFPGIESEQP